MPSDGATGTPATVRELAVSVSEPVPVANNRTLSIDDPGRAWYVEHGAVNVFVAEYQDGALAALPSHLVHAEAGRLIFGCDTGDFDENVQVVVKGLPGSAVRPVPIAAFGAAPPGGPRGASAGEADSIAMEVATQIDLWMTEIARAAARDIEHHPVADTRLMPGPSQEASGVVASERGVAWLVGDGASMSFLGTEQGRDGERGQMPLAPPAWVEVDEPARYDVKRTAELAREMGVPALLSDSLREFHRVAINAFFLNRHLLLADAVNQRRESVQWRSFDRERARQALYATARGEAGEDAGAAGEPLLDALMAVARHEGITLRVPETMRYRDAPTTLREVLDLSGVRARRIRLAGKDRWWLGDSGAMLAYRDEDARPVALLPGSGGWYRVFDPATGATTRVSRTTAGAFRETAWLLYRPLPESARSSAGFRDLFGVVGRRLAGDGVKLALTGLLSGVLALLPAMAIGVLIDDVIPSGDGRLLLQLAATLVGVAVVAALAQIMRGTAVMRIEGRLAAGIEAALMDRVMRARPNAFREYASGELGMRLMTFQQVRDRVAGVAVSSLLAAIFLLPSFGLIFLYSTSMGWLVLALGLVSLAVAAAFAAAQLGPQRRLLTTSRRLAGRLFQFIAGVAKLQASRSEGAAFAAWARLYATQKKAEVGVFALNEHVVALGISLPLVAGTLVAAVMVHAEPGRLSVADFLIVFAVSQTFFQAVAALFAAFESFAAFVPSLDEVKPILNAPPERSTRSGLRVGLRGEVLFDRVSFRYDGDGPTILDEVTVQASPGEFVAIVGESGAGKSTLANLAVGLERPTSGGVYYDGHEFGRLDPESVRSQIGVVAQGAILQPGTILSNIVGAMGDLTITDAWRAARLAALDQDIAAMPMQMYTMVSEDGGTLSGGQRQRLSIAAMLVRNPRIMILDEATGWLDTVTQDITMKNIEGMSATRIVIAHRLSTIRKAHRIYVLQAGRVVQEGTFEALAATAGPFQDLIRRQET